LKPTLRTSLFGDLNSQRGILLIARESRTLERRPAWRTSTRTRGFQAIRRAPDSDFELLSKLERDHSVARRLGPL
jgi:hypothetical protein